MRYHWHGHQREHSHNMGVLLEQTRLVFALLLKNALMSFLETLQVRAPFHFLFTFYAFLENNNFEGGGCQNCGVSL